LNRYVQEDEVSELYGVDRHDPTMTKIALPLLVGILVVDAVLYVVREEVLQLDRRPKPKAHLGRLSSWTPFSMSRRQRAEMLTVG
jgi:hypothetical protein